MAIALYLAMTSAEFRYFGGMTPSPAWMACHFSTYATGLSNLPDHLPEGSLLIVNDRTPVSGHDPALICDQISTLMERFSCSGILMDFQREGETQTRAIAEAIAALPYPAAVTPAYAEGLPCGVFLPPIPLTTLPQAYFAPWQGREIWLEVATEAYTIRVDKEGNHRLPSSKSVDFYPHTDPQLHCSYAIAPQKEYVDFHLHRAWENLSALMEACSALGVSRYVGLYQQLGSSACQALAQDTALPQS